MGERVRWWKWREESRGGREGGRKGGMVEGEGVVEGRKGKG